MRWKNKLKKWDIVLWIQKSKLFREKKKIKIINCNLKRRRRKKGNYQERHHGKQVVTY